MGDMDPQSQQHSGVRHVRLPSGKTVEVVVVTGTPSPAHDTARHAERALYKDLHVCPDCESQLLQPRERQHVGGDSWQLELGCANCEWHLCDVFERAEVEAFDEEAEEGTQMLLRDLRWLSAANMEDEVERFVEAINADQILPFDF
jgi:hypothetical protein